LQHSRAAPAPVAISDVILPKYRDSDDGNVTGIFKIGFRSFAAPPCTGKTAGLRTAPTASLRAQRSNPPIRYAARWIASRSLSSGAHSRDPLARNDGFDRSPDIIFGHDVRIFLS